MGCIYMRTSPNNENYIGFTSFKEEKRWNEHVFIAFYEKSKDYNSQLSKAIRKYGPSNFTCTILEDDIDDINVLKEREIYWISYYNTFKNGLNGTLGGDGNKTRNTEEIRKLWEDGHCVRDICLLLNSCPNTVLKHLDMTPKEAEKRGPVYKTKNSINYFGDFKTGKATPVNCFDTKTGKLVRSFSSFYEASKFLNVKTAAHIIRAANGYVKTAYGYIWSTDVTINQLSKEMLEAKMTRKTHTIKKVVCIETNKMYLCCKHAEELTGICYRSISFVCNGYQKTAGGFHWRYATAEDVNNLILIKKEKKAERLAPNARSVLCVETGKIFESLKSAGEFAKRSSSAILCCCQGKCKTSGGYHWKYA